MPDKKVLFLCAHNQSRSTTAEGLLVGEKGYQVKSRALWRYMPRKVTKEEGKWADEIYVMMPGMKKVAVEVGLPEHKVKSLWIPDAYQPCELSLLQELKRQLAGHGIHVKKDLGQAEKDCEDVMVRKGIYGEAVSLEWFGMGYYPLWHLEEGEKRKREVKAYEDSEVERARRMLREMKRHKGQFSWEY